MGRKCEVGAGQVNPKHWHYQGQAEPGGPQALKKHARGLWVCSYLSGGTYLSVYKGLEFRPLVPSPSFPSIFWENRQAMVASRVGLRFRGEFLPLVEAS